MYIGYIDDRQELGFSCLKDIESAKNGEAVYLFFRELPSNSKDKAKRLFGYGMFLFQLGQPLVPCAAAVVIPLPPAVERLSPIKQDKILSNKNSYPQIAHILEEKVDKIRLTDEQIKQFNNLAIKLNSGSITMEEAILQLRGGDGLGDVVAVIAFVIFVNWYDSFFGVEAFQPNPLPHKDPFGWLSGKHNSKNAGNSQCLSHPPSRAEQCKVDENRNEKKVEIVYRIKENPALIREAEKAGRDPVAQKSMNHLVEQLSLGNRNPGIGTENVFKNVNELRDKSGARVYYREVDGKIEILAKSVKSNQQTVINILKKIYK